MDLRASTSQLDSEQELIVLPCRLKKSKTRGDRLKTLVASKFKSIKTAYLSLGIDERTLTRWCAGGGMSGDNAKKIAAQLNEQEKQFVFQFDLIQNNHIPHAELTTNIKSDKSAPEIGLFTLDTGHENNMTDTKKPRKADTKTTSHQIDEFHALLIRAYRTLTPVEKLNLTAQVLNIPTIKPTGQADLIADILNIDDQPLNEYEAAIIMKLRAMRPAVIAVTLINRLVTEINN